MRIQASYLLGEWNWAPGPDPDDMKLELSQLLRILKYINWVWTR